MTCVLYLFWLCFVYPRPHPGWIGPIGESAGADFIWKPAYRYSIPLSLELHSAWRNRLALLMPFRISRIGVTCFLYFWLSFVYPRSNPSWIGPIGEFKEAGFILEHAYRYSCFFFPWIVFSILGLFCSSLSFWFYLELLFSLFWLTDVVIVMLFFRCGKESV